MRMKLMIMGFLCLVMVSGVFATTNITNTQITTDGIGLGTTSPDADLEIEDLTNTTNELIRLTHNDTTGSGSRIASFVNGGANAVVGGLDHVRTGAGTYEWQFWNWDTTALSKVMVIDTAGRVGIGRNNMTHTLDVNGTFRVQNENATLQLRQEGGASVLRIKDNNGLSVLSLEDAGHAYQFRVFNDSGTEKLALFDATTAQWVMTVLPDGNVGIGSSVTNPQYPLEVDGIIATPALQARDAAPSIITYESDAPLDEKFYFEAAPSNGTLVSYTANDGNNLSTVYRRIHRTGYAVDGIEFPTGNVVIGTTGTGSQKLHVAGSANITGTLYTTAGIIAPNGGLQLASNLADGNGGQIKMENLNVTPSVKKYIRTAAADNGTLQIIDNAYLEVLMSMADSGDTYFKGDIGIGTLTPDADLEIEDLNNSLNELVRLTHNDTTGSGSRIASYVNGGANTVVGALDHVRVGAGDYEWRLSNWDTSTLQEYLVMDKNGKLTSTASGGEIVIINGNGNNPQVELRDQDGDGGTPYIDFANDNTSDYDMRLMQTTDNILEVYSLNDEANFKVTAPNASISRYYMTGQDGTGWSMKNAANNRFELDYEASGSGSTVMTILPTIGWLGIGTIPSKMLDVNGDAVMEDLTCDAISGDSISVNDFMAISATAPEVSFYESDAGDADERLWYTEVNNTILRHYLSTLGKGSTEDWLEVTRTNENVGNITFPNGEVEIGAVSGDGAGKALCVKADGNIGTCTDAVGAGGTCTCA